MAFVSEQRSALNPNAPLFIPAAFRQVEDFSPKWWDLVKTSTWFQGYWISQHQDDDFGGSVENATKKEAVDVLPETFDFSVEDDFPSLDAEFEELVFSSGAEYFIDPAACDPQNACRTQIGINLDAKALLKNLATPKSSVGPPKYREKPAQRVAVRCGLGRIQQPR